ncbi:MAG: GntR family transcriptional regulator [Betaproteobacteria bacterium]|nr:GntR family transcriptional regulator [Betaproteobacteria bacterium]NDC98908.1 GntR family transcriptional regulator [Betaproteobacteria bacterium]
MMLDQKKARHLVADDTYQRLRHALFNFVLMPGDRITEQQLCERFNVSRTPVRQALFRLQQEGYVEVLFRSGWRVLPLDFKTFDALYDFRILIETESVQRLCDGRIQGSLERTNSVLEDLRATWFVQKPNRNYNIQTVSRLDEEFHCAIVRAVGNPVIEQTHLEITERIRIIRKLDFTRNTRIDATYDEHARILRAILTKRSEQARLLLRAHVEASQTQVRQITLHQLEQTRQTLSAKEAEWVY